MGVLRLKELLKEKGVTGKELADEVGMSVTGMSNVVKGQSLPRQEVLLQIAEVLDVDIRELFTPTKKINKKTLYVKEGDNYIPVGDLILSH